MFRINLLCSHASYCLCFLTLGQKHSGLMFCMYTDQIPRNWRNSLMSWMHQIHCVCSVRENCVSGLNLEHTGFLCLCRLVSHVIRFLGFLLLFTLSWRKKESPENNIIFLEGDNPQLCLSFRTYWDFFFSERVYYLYL